MATRQAPARAGPVPRARQSSSCLGCDFWRLDRRHAARISSKEWVVVRGRWTFDSGHTGWNEIHATRIVQKIDRADVPMDANGFRDYWKRWCTRLSEVPQVIDAGLHPLTPEQQTVADNQARPENQWVLHPEVDGCIPGHDHNDPPPIILKTAVDR